MEESYWHRYWTTRRSRRKFLGGAALAGAGAAGIVLVGCSSSSSNKTPTSGATKPSGSATSAASPTSSNPFANAKPGGTFKNVVTLDPVTLDPYKNLSFSVKGFAAYVYSRLMKYDTVWGKDPSLQTPTGDLADKVESTPDGLTWTVTLRDGIKFQNLPPLNGRDMTIDDVKYSWGRMTGPTSQNATQVAFVDTVTYPDNKTVQFKLKTPNADMLDVLADCNLFWIIPKEADSTLNIATTPIGTGPWMMTNYTPSSSITFKKNPTWYLSGHPYLDEVDAAIIPEYANRKAQYLAGNTDVTDLISQDLQSVVGGLKGTKLNSLVPELMSFFYFDNHPDSPWTKDPRVRVAISECIDRDGINELAFDISKIKSQGFDITVNWNNLIPAGMKRWWLDPKSSAQGSSAKNFKYNATDAKQLLEAAGAAGMTVKYQYPASIYGQVFDSVAQANIQFMEAIGIKVNTDVQNYASQYITQTFSGNFTGIAFGYETPFPEGGSYPIRFFTNNPLNHGHVNDPQLAQLAVQQQSELDPVKRKQLFNQIQQLNAEKMYYIPNQPGAGPAWTAYNPRIGGATHVNTVGYGAPTEVLPFYWIES